MYIVSLNVNQTQVTVVTAATPLPIYQLNVGVLDYILLVFLVICYLQPNIYFEEICIKYDGNRCTAVKETMIVKRFYITYFILFYF